MKGVEPDRAVILEPRSIRKSPAQIRHPGFPLVKDGTAEKRVTVHVEHHLREAFGLIEKLVGLEPGNCR